NGEAEEGEEEGGGGVDRRGYAVVGLVPYCGLLKTGGYAVQMQQPQQQQQARRGCEGLPEIWFEGSGELVMEDEGEGEGAGAEGIRTPVRGIGKRRFVDEEEEESYQDDEGRKDVEESTRIEGIRKGFENIHQASSMALRPIAQARNRRPSALTTRKVTCEEDFGEAPFLRRLDDECMEFD
ncbi:MAG: hypothetical protein LQ346_001320, partial [Caloplaca aetnensis]